MSPVLSEGSRQYNRARKIHPRDPIGKLGYYQPTSCSSIERDTSSQASSDYLKKQATGSSAGSSVNSYQSPSTIYHDSIYGDFTGHGRTRKRLVGAARLKSKLSSEGSLTSGISETTQVDSTGKTSFLIPLGDPNWKKHLIINSKRECEYLEAAGLKEVNSFEPQGRTDKNRLVSGRPEAASEYGPPMTANRRMSTILFREAAKGPGARLKRRANRRHNRRMITGNYDDQLIDPYALSELFSQSEIPGFREIFASDSYLRKFCWVVAFLFMTILSLNDMTELVTEFYDYPITVRVRHIDSSRLPFPAVTVCNLNVVRFSALCATNKFELFKQIPSEMREKLCGIQVEKEKNASDSDISDINNIGISTTTTSSTTISPTTNMPTSSLSITGSNAGFSSQGTTINPDDSNLNMEHKLTEASAPAGSSTTPTSDSAISQYPSSSSLAPASTTRRTRVTADGSLDLGPDFVGQAIADNRKWARLSAQTNMRSLRKRSILVGGRAFASGLPLRVQNSQVSRRQPSKEQVVMKVNNGVQSSIRGQNGAVTQSHVGPSQNPFLPSSMNPFNLHGPPTTPFPGQQPSQGSPHGSSGGTGSGGGVISSGALPDDFELTERQERELQENLTNWLAVMYNRDPKLTRLLGHQFDDMLMRCTIKSINCTHQRSFENSFTPTEGNCFTYRSKVRRRPSAGSPSTLQQQINYMGVFEEANLAGTAQGLELVLNLEKNEYISSSSQVGALVMIHHPSDLGYAASEATFVAPEFTTYIGLKMVNITRLAAPYPEYCVDTWPSKFADSLIRNSTYSQQACLRICLQKTIQSHCQCQSAQLPIVELDAAPPLASFAVAINSANHSRDGHNVTNATAGHTGRPQQLGEQQRIIICDTRKPATRHCVKEVMVRAADRVHNCECPPKCGVVRYDKTISMAKWPTREDRVSFDRGKMDVNFQNLAKVIVYFQTMTCEEVSQQAVFNAAKLFSALGGIMGMYVGFSFLSVFEIFEVMSRKMWHHFKVKISNTSSRLLDKLR